MKKYILLLSTHFPVSHPKAGEPTYFIEKYATREKKHTIRANYELWAKRIEEIQQGKAELVIRCWSGKPYRSKQYEWGRLGKEEGVSVQMVDFGGDIMTPTIDHWSQPDPETRARNDGLQFVDWLDWFEKYDLSKPMAIIHFGKWKYVDENLICYR